MKADAPLRWWIRERLEERQYFLIKVAQRGIMSEQTRIDLRQPLQNCIVRSSLLPQSYERADDEYAHLDGAIATQNIGGHDRTVFRKGPWSQAGITVLLGTCRNLR